MSSESDPADLQRAKTLFQTGNDATLKSNLDYAIDMYREACKLVPDNMMFRQALRTVERRKFNNDPSKVGMLVGARNQPILMRGAGLDRRGISITPWRFARRRLSTIRGTWAQPAWPPRLPNNSG